MVDHRLSHGVGRILDLRLIYIADAPSLGLRQFSGKA